MAITARTNYAASVGTQLANRPPGAFMVFECDTFAELPSVDVLDGDTAYVAQTGIFYERQSGAWVQVAQQEVPVSSLSQLPAPVSGVITLADATNYRICGEVNIGTNTIKFGARSTIRGANRVNDRLVGDTTGTMFLAESGSVVAFFSEIGLRCPNGTLLDASGTSVSFVDVAFGTILHGGSVALSGAFSFGLRTSSLVSAFTSEGFTFTGTSTSAMRVLDNLARNNAGVMLNLGTAVFAAITIARNTVDSAAGQTCLDGTTGGANVTSGGILALNTFFGAGTPVATLQRTDPGWVWDTNSGLLNTPHGSTHADGGTDEVALDASQVTSGQFAMARLASGTPSGAKFIRDDGVLAVPPGLGDMLKSENLSGLANYTTARSNLGLGTAATTAASDYATAAQGALAASALQPAGNGSALTGLTKSQVGLANVDNTSDANKPISTATQTALDGKQAAGSYATGTGTANGTNTGDQTITLTGDVTGSGTGSFAATIAAAAVTLAKMANMATASLIYRRTAGTGTPEVNTLATLKTDLALVKADVGLSNVDNTSDAAKPVSTATQTALDAKQATLVSGTNIKTVNGSTLLGSGNLAVSAADPSYTPGSFTVATGTARLILKRMALASSERATVAGTARLRLA